MATIKRMKQRQRKRNSELRRSGLPIHRVARDIQRDEGGNKKK